MDTCSKVKGKYGYGYGFGSTYLQVNKQAYFQTNCILLSFFKHSFSLKFIFSLSLIHAIALLPFAGKLFFLGPCARVG